MDYLWTVGEVSEAVKGQIEVLVSEVIGSEVIGSDVQGVEASGINSVSIDSRTLDKDALYIAIQGVSQDGHAFVRSAFQAGAKACLVSKDFELDGSEAADGSDFSGGILIRVEDTFKALQDLGMVSRKRCSGKIIAVTGSAGKTGTKEALRVMFEKFGRTHASVKSFNNHWGVPLTLARMPRDCEFGIFEVGMNHAGEISPLSKLIQPHVALITTVAPAHIGHFANEEEIADAKAEIFDGLMDGGACLLPADNRHFDRLKQAALEAKVQNVYSFGKASGVDVHLMSGEFGAERSVVQTDCFGEVIDFSISIPGEHIALNFLGALGCLKLAGCDVLQAASVLSELIAPPGRGVRHQLHLESDVSSKVLLIDESYNANPPSMDIALKNLSALKDSTYCRRIAVLGDMLELGAHSVYYHREIAPLIASLDVDLVFASGEMMSHMFNELPQDKKGAFALNSKDLIEPLEESLQSGDVVMIKGSLGSDMGSIVTALCEKYK